MDKRKIDQDVYERYLDATVALFMEHYSAERAQNLHNELAGDGKRGVEVSAALDERCRVLIRKESARRKRKAFLKSALKGLRFVASFAVIILALACVLFVSVEAIRVPIINFYITHTDKYLEFTSNYQGLTVSDVGFNPEDPLAGMLPEGYEIDVLDIPMAGEISAVYVNSGDEVFFSINNSRSTIRMDTEGAQKVEEIQICGCDGMLIVEDNYVRIVWGHETLGKTFVLCTTALTEADAIDLAERIMQRI